MTSSPDNTVEKILKPWRDLIENEWGSREDGGTSKELHEEVDQAKQSLDSHYLSIFLKLVGEDIDEEGLGWDMYYSDPKCCPGDDVGYIRNKFRQELRTALQDRLGEKSK